MGDTKRTAPLEQLFGSTARVRLLRFFLGNDADDNRFFVRELVRKLNVQLNGVRRELQNLEALGLLESSSGESQKKRYYKLNKNFPLYSELKALISKAEFFTENRLIEELKKLGAVNLLILTGHFVGIKDSPTDMLIVGKIKRSSLAKKVADLEKEMCREINYTLFSPREYKYRKDITDKFLYQILGNKKIVAINDEQNG